MTSSHEPTTTMAEAELDSDGSSCGERDTWKRVRGDSADLSVGTKKRRKQATPVRLSSSIATGAHEDACEDEREDEDSEGKPSSRSPLPSNEHHHHQHHHHHQPSLKDENLNNEFRCQHCGRFFDSDETLNVHMDDEHGGASQATPSVTIKVEPAQQLDQTNDGPVSLLSVKNFATTWLTSGSQQHVQSQTQMQSQSEESWSGSPVNQIVTMTNHLQALSGFPGTLAQYLPLPGFPLPDPQQVPRSSLGPVPIKIFNPDAYCDMCNKEFCNKYFLKTHKANKHGIYVDSPAPSTAMDVANVFGATNFHAGNTSVKLEPPTTPPQKRFRNEESTIKKHKQKDESSMDQQSDGQQIPLSQNEEDRETSRDSPGGMEALLKQEYGVEQEDATFMPAPRHLSPQSIQQARDSGFSADLLRRLGVINPDAFCEICCKEYCNKYFLRTHKMKRHGIVIQDNERSPSNPGTAAATWHQVQTSPLNLIVTDTTAAGSESNDRIGEEHECKSCGIRFQTIGLYQAHCRKIHEGEEHGTPKQEYDVESSDQRTDSISEDLQKLQTMIMQLNGLDSGKGLSCAVCGKECDSRSALRVHMATEHGVANDEVSSPQETSPTQIISTIFCTLCEKDYPSQEALRRHISEEHQPVVSSVITLPTLPPTIIASSVSSTPINQTLSSQTTTMTTTTTTTTEKKMTSLTPTSSYCEICNKELCNKYFMKTHMQRMHGIEIENGAQIGGVICNICNKELCSKYFLRVHKHNTHGIVDENTSSASTSNKQEPYDASGTEDSALKQELGDLSHKYFIHFTEVCPICSRRFRSIKWLKAHLMGDHGKVGIDKWREMEQQYQETPRTSGKSVVPVPPVKNILQTSNLKIPNGLEIGQQVKSTDCTNLGNQVLSNLFGSLSEEHQLKNYHCAYCNFATSVLPLLFLHERSHVSFQENVEGDRPLLCPICSQDFHQPDLLHQHLLAKHQIPTLISQFQHPLLNNLRPDADVKANDVKNKTDQDVKDNRAGCSPQIDRNISEPAKNQRQNETAVQVTAHGAYKCAQCGYATTNLNRIKKHVRKDHKMIGDPTESVIAELSKTLKDVANKQKVPACYAMPQDMNSNPDKTIMQPFLIEEQDLMQTESSSAKRFAPALVYLPVKSRISNALTASFTLTPA
ncbi:zinc finger protein 516 [Lasius niger]|uniref:Zinc finger protein 516 n=1 Tax=Lasius niger TaxID=67767 RepID=A0A0J7KA67_LASNI|nr:zinc finger protein 516 [Lasius niger]